jgi:HPt (histidine-containing phosphotransfer) domain-containing protein
MKSPETPQTNGPLADWHQFTQMHGGNLVSMRKLISLFEEECKMMGPTLQGFISDSQPNTSEIGNYLHKLKSVTGFMALTGIQQRIALLEGKLKADVAIEEVRLELNWILEKCLMAKTELAAKIAGQV